jgi:SPP1 gp7 family putative phage head morphogenesis protein
VASEASPIGVPFDEAIKAFEQRKDLLPTRHWTDLWEGMHARAFVVAGATDGELLAGLRKAVDDAITKGTTLEQFRQEFDQLVSKHGWSHSGTPGWRSRVIYETNLRTAYQAGRWKQQTSPEMLQRRPYWEYVHGDSVHPRPEHRRWHGQVLRWDDPWWAEHYPPNGWGCKCTVYALNERDLKRRGKDGPDTAPAVTRRDWTPPNPMPGKKSISVPEGVDPGWAYNPGEAAWGKDWAQQLIDRGPYKEESGFLPKDLELELKPKATRPAPATLGPRAHTPEQYREAIRPVLGMYTDPTGAVINVTDALVDHILADPKRMDDRARERYFPWIPDIIQAPREIWLGFLRHDSGYYSLRRRYFAVYQMPGGEDQVAGVVVDTVNNQFVALTAFQATDPTGGRLRYGRLLWQEKGRTVADPTAAPRPPVGVGPGKAGMGEE